MRYKLFLFFLFFPIILFCKAIETFYGTIEVEEPILIELIESKPFQRLKKVHQYGIAYYTTHKEEYTRYDHCLGVFAVLRVKGANLDEQIAGLLHDISHTVFSHMGDYFQKNHQESYQDNIHPWFLKKYGIGKILEKHGKTIDQILHKSGRFLALEQELPDLCADRIDYNIQGAYYRGFLSKDEALELFKDLQFTDGRWVCTKPELIKKIVRFSFHMSEYCWGSPTNFLQQSWLVKAVLRGMKLGYLTNEDIYFGCDDDVWQRLKKATDAKIQKYFLRFTQPHQFFSLVDEKKADVSPKMKFRGIDPWVLKDGKLMRLSECDQDILQEYISCKSRMSKGWPIKVYKSKMSWQSRVQGPQ